MKVIVTPCIIVCQHHVNIVNKSVLLFQHRICLNLLCQGAPPSIFDVGCRCAIFIYDIRVLARLGNSSVFILDIYNLFKS